MVSRMLWHMEKHMTKMIAMQDIRTSLAKIADEVEKGQRFIVIRNSRPAFQLTPLESMYPESGGRVMTLREIRARFEANPVDPQVLQEREVDEIIHDVHKRRHEGRG